MIVDEVDDYLCWTIVGICTPFRPVISFQFADCRIVAKFQYTFFDAFGHDGKVPSMPITPFPTLFTAPLYRPPNNSLELTVSNFFYENPETRQQVPLDVYLGGIGPLRTRVYQGMASYAHPRL
jgi:recombining binding protein (suppressor of hairless)